MSTTPRCDWAACDKPGHKLVDGYWHCRGCLLIHYRQTGQHGDADARQRLEELPHLYAAGLTDQEIADALNLTLHRIETARRALGLHRPKGRPADPRHGTLIGYKRHKREGTPVCGPCRAHRAQVDALNHQKRVARRQAEQENRAS